MEEKRAVAGPGAGFGRPRRKKLAGTKWKLAKLELQCVTMEGDALASMGGLGMEFADDTTVEMSFDGCTHRGRLCRRGQYGSHRIF